MSQFEEITQETADLLLERVRSLPQRRKTRSWLLPMGLLVAFVAMTALIASLGYLEQGWPFLIELILLCGVGVWIWNSHERREMRTIEALALCKDRRSIGCLLEAMPTSNRRTRQVIENSLIELLPLLSEEDSHLLNTSQREALNALLYGDSGDMALLALKAMEQVGDGTALPYLTSIAAGKGIPGKLRNRKTEVQQHAQHTVEVIRQRIEKQNQANVLLRASQLPGTQSEQLLRPAHSNPIVNPGELLRPENTAYPNPKEDRL